MVQENGDLWIFGYGSLMWQPGFPHTERHLATLRGYHRSLCIYSHVHRGTPDRPGLVLGLDRGGSCRGIAFRVEAIQRDATLAYLRERELVTNVYQEQVLSVVLIEGRRVSATTYVVDRHHVQYAGRLSRDRLLTHVRQGVGKSGPNPEYIRSTYRHMREIGVEDAELAWLAAQFE